jgi:serine/threonine protein kinase
MSSLASNLLGKKIGKWKVIKKLNKGQDSTGGCFSSGYEVEEDETRRLAFMKAINIEYAIKNAGVSGSFMDMMNQVSEEYIHERDLLIYCRAEKMDRIVTAIDHAEYKESGSLYPVPYLIFELCKKGDVRRHANLNKPGLSWRLQIFHGACVGLNQLHAHNIVHQDLKPSNILIFNDADSRIADLGRAAIKSKPNMFSSPNFEGDGDYAPIELLYGHINQDWEVRRKSADLYMLGSLFTYLISNTHWNTEIISRMPPELHPLCFSGGFHQALPFVQRAMEAAIEEIIKEIKSEKMKLLVTDFIRWLCEPEPEKRGHPEDHRTKFNKFSLERIISVADRLVTLSKIES